MVEHRDTRGLPPEVTAHDDHLEAAPTPGTLARFTIVGTGMVVLGLVLAALAPGELGDSPLARFGIAAVAVALGALAVLAPRRQVRLDREGAMLRAPGSSRSLPWEQVREVRIELQQHRSRLGAVSHQFGGWSLGVGSRSRRANRRLVGRTPREVAVLVVEAAGGEDDIVLSLDAADPEQAGTLAARLRDEPFVPEAVPVQAPG
jgi:hypothetical protein